MSLTKAIELVKNTIESDCYVLENEVVENEAAWYIPCRNFDRTKIIIGHHLGYIADKQTFELHRPGSAFGIETWMEGYKIGLRFKAYDLVIIKINNEALTLEYLKEIRLHYYRIEEEGGDIWRIPKSFPEKMVKERLANLPCIFRNQSFTLSVPAFIKIRDSNAFDYELVEVLTHDRLSRGELFS